MAGVKNATEVHDAICIKQLNVNDLSFGTYVAGVKAASIGYILVKDQAGTARRWMVQDT